VHYGHIELVRLARDHCANSAHVLLSVLAPSPGHKLSLKNGADAISDDFRWAMLQLALIEHEDIALLVNESKEQLHARLVKHLTAHYKQPVTVHMTTVCGPENLLSIKSKRIYLEGVICVHSRALPMNVHALLDKHPYKHCIQFVAREASVHQHRSSTLIRNLVRSFYKGTITCEELKTQLGMWTSPLVVEYMLQHKLWADTSK